LADVDLDPMPARQSWEQPPPAGWTSHLRGVGLEILGFGAVLVAAVGTWQVVVLAWRVGGQRGAGWAAPLLLWCLALVPASAVIVFLWRWLGGLALLGAMLTDHGRVARFGGRPPVWLERPPETGLRLVHLSDLHVTEGDRVRLVERVARGGGAALPALLATAEVKKADVVVITGDVTDRGTAAAWQRVRAAIDGAGVAGKVVLVPGNHDLSLIDPWGGLRDPGGHWRRNDRFGIVQLANLLKFCEAFAATGGGQRGYVLGAKAREERPYAGAWADAEAAVRPLVNALPEMPVPRQHLGPGYLARRREARAYTARIAAARNKLLALFPMAVPLPARNAVVFVLNSCTPISRHPATNALGWVGRAQYRRLARLARLYPQHLKLVALHHHVVRRGEEMSHGLMSRIVAKFTVLGDTAPLVQFCRRQSVRAVLNGHRHMSYKLRLENGTVILSAPSSTLGDELAHDPRPQLECYEVAATIEPPTVGIYHRSVRLTPPC
jgi:3',5'-cyclic AMP phosphodiesterase CpdA